MSALGPESAQADVTSRYTSATVAQTIGAPDILASAVFRCGVIRKIFTGPGGNIAVKRSGDTAFVVYATAAKTYLEGQFIAVGGTGSGSDPIAVIFEV